MKIFWSWQSDTHQDSAHHFVREVLEGLAAEINGLDGAEAADRPDDDDAEVEDVAADHPLVSVDHDTKNVGGSPEIAKTILGKIRECAVFVADVTPVATRTQSGKLIPNPNVMIELGYALHVLGHERIVLVMNTAEGAKLSKLPFDLKHWRAPVSYALKKGADDAYRETVAADLKATLRARILPGLRKATAAMREDRRRTHRQPEFLVRTADEETTPLQLPHTLQADQTPTLSDIRRQTPKLPVPDGRASTLAGLGGIAGARNLGSGLSGLLRPRPVSEWSADEIQTHNTLIDAYYSEYGAYLAAHDRWRQLLARTFVIDLVLENVGTAPGTSIDVELRFPEGIALYEEDGFAEEPKAPEAPEQRPLSAGFGYARPAPMNFDPPRVGPYLPSATQIDPADRSVQFTTDQLKHHHTRAIDSLIVSFAQETDIAPFVVDYAVTANEPIDPTEGQVHFAIRRLVPGEPQAFS